MYVLNNQEEAALKIIIKNTRIDYLKKNKYVMKEESLIDDTIVSNGKMEEDLENKIEKEINAEKLGNIFSDGNLSKIMKVLTHDERLVLFLYYIECKNDEEIGKIMFLTKSGVTKKRNRALNKIEKECIKRGIINV